MNEYSVDLFDLPSNQHYPEYSPSYSFHSCVNRKKRVQIDDE
jgi:hypothetical protein